MTYEELKIKLDLYDPEDVLRSVGRKWSDYWFVVCDEGDCHIFQQDGTEDDIRKIDIIVNGMIHEDIKKIVIPDSVSHIGDYAFYCCRGLESVVISYGVTRINDGTFSYCYRLTNVTIPDSMTSIGNCAFSYCKELTCVMIPDNVASIGEAVFSNCSKLKSLVFKGKTIDEVKTMKNYPWRITDESIIKCI